MLSFEVREAQWQEVDLEPERRVLLGDEGIAGDRLRGRIALQTPICVELDAEHVKDDEELARLVELEAAERAFYLVHFACTFQATLGEPFHQADLAVTLLGGGEPSNSPPIAFSMSPRRLSFPIESTRKVSLGFKLTSLGAGIELGPAVEVGEKATGEEPYLEALNELSSTPGWSFFRTRGAEIRGSHRLNMVVRAPRGCPARGIVQLSATIERRFLGLVAYRAMFGLAPQLAFTLP